MVQPFLCPAFYGGQRLPPFHVRVFTDEENNFKPQIISEAIHLDLDGLDMEKVYALKKAEKLKNCTNIC